MKRLSGCLGLSAALACSTPAPAPPTAPTLPDAPAAAAPSPAAQPAEADAGTGAVGQTRDRSARPEPKGRVEFESDEQRAEYQHCKNDRECTIAGNGCCNAGLGDPGIGIRKDKLNAFDKLAPCEERLCPMASFRRAPDAKARCVEGRCFYEGVF